jgi:hypothetical protein
MSKGKHWHKSSGSVPKNSLDRFVVVECDVETRVSRSLGTSTA